MKHLVIVIYDSSTNSMLKEDVIHQLVLRLEKETQLHATIVSYDYRTKNPTSLLQKYTHARLTVHSVSQAPFMGTISLWYAAWQLTKILSALESYELIAWDPLAGWICLSSYNPSLCTKITIYAHEPGVAQPERERSVSCNSSDLWHQFQARCMTTIERDVYRNPAPLIVVPSETLRKHLHEKYGTRLERIRVEQSNL